jgi:hypothetical protein
MVLSNWPSGFLGPNFLTCSLTLFSVKDDHQNVFVFQTRFLHSCLSLQHLALKRNAHAGLRRDLVADSVMMLDVPFQQLLNPRRLH